MSKRLRLSKASRKNSHDYQAHPPGSTPTERMHHTLAMFGDIDGMAIMATAGVWEDESGRPVMTGVTWSDLREIMAENARLREGMRQIAHSMSQACIPGNDRAREVELTLRIATEAVSEG